MSMIFKINFYTYKRKWFSLFSPSTGILGFPSYIKITEFLYQTDQFFSFFSIDPPALDRGQESGSRTSTADGKQKQVQVKNKWQLFLKFKGRGGGVGELQLLKQVWTVPVRTDAAAAVRTVQSPLTPTQHSAGVNNKMYTMYTHTHTPHSRN